VLLEAYGQFNHGEWHDSHETLEDLWIGSEGEMRAFYQGLLQIAVALYHWQNGNFKGANILIESGMSHLGRVRPVCQRIDVEALRQAVFRFSEALTSLGPERMTEVDPCLIPRLKLLREDSNGNECSFQELRP
jgi:predicted metal-dependent hydrolase